MQASKSSKPVNLGGRHVSRVASIWEVKRFLVNLVVVLLILGCKAAGAANVDLEKTSPSARVAIVFVHGILGNASETFAANGRRPWPEWIGSDSRLKAPVYVLSLSYASEPLQRASTIQEIATRLRAKLQVDRQIFERYDKVVFVTHSMGGLVVRRLLLQLSRDDPKAFERVAGVFFLAVPAGGSDLASGASWISGNPQFGNMRPEDANVFLQADADDWSTLMRRRPAARPYPRAYCAYETQRTGPVMIVPRSRSQFMCDETPIAYDRSHASIVKPSDPSDEVHQYVVARLNRLIADADVAFSVSAELMSRSGKPLPEEIDMRSGDQFAIRIRAARPAWLYVFGIDGRGKVQRYFPSAVGGSQATPLSVLRLPIDETQVLVLDQVTGVEQFVVIASTQPDAALANLGVQVSGKEGEAHKELTAALQKRGAYIAQRAKSPTPPMLDRALEIDGSGNRARATLTFWHQ